MEFWDPDDVINFVTKSGKYVNGDAIRRFQELRWTGKKLFASLVHQGEAKCRRKTRLDSTGYKFLRDELIKQVPLSLF